MTGKPFQKGCVPWNKGKKHTEESRHKMVEWRKNHSEEVRENIIAAVNTPEVKEKLSENNRMKDPVVAERCAAANRGKKRSIEFCNNVSKRMSESPRSDIHKKRISDSLKQTIRSDLHPHTKWKGGITPLIRTIRKIVEYKIWMAAIHKRDNYTCTRCKQRGGKLQVHHITAFADIIVENGIVDVEGAVECKELWDVGNGVTLCKDCHTQLHSGVF